MDNDKGYGMLSDDLVTGFLPDCEVDIGGNNTPVMVCGHGDSYTKKEWNKLTYDEQYRAICRHQLFHYPSRARCSVDAIEK
jgi:hypothetical protein